MRRPSASTFAGVAVMATTLAVLPLTSASAAFDDGDYDLATACSVDATLKVRGNGNGISVESDTTFAVVKGDDGATIIEFGVAGTPDDNTVYALTPDGDGVACAPSSATDDEVSALLGLSAESTVDAFAEDLESEASEVSEASAEDEASADEATEKVELCHNVENNPKTIEVSVDALDAHLEHGDLEGECPEDLVSKKSEKEAEREEAKADRDAAKAERDAAKAERKAAKGGDDTDEAGEADS